MKVLRILALLTCMGATASAAPAALASGAAPASTPSSGATRVHETVTLANPTSRQLYEARAPIPLSHRATEDASQDWLRTGVAASLVGTNGQVLYPYGQSRPTVTCAPLHICVIDLMQGERITNIAIGDSVRWLVQSADAASRPVVVVKPTQAGLVTNLVVTTDVGRIYYLTLVSDPHDYVPLIGFYDPQQLVIHLQQRAQEARAAEQAKTEARKQAVVAPLGRIDPAQLDFDFRCKADDGHSDLDNADLKPVRVFAGGGHTYLQMPGTMQDTDAPAVFDTTGGQTALMNSRLVHGYFVLDGLPQQFKLVVGVGKNARSVSCRHDPVNAGFWAR
ncbi:Conjugal transfer protein TrbG/VirB9/CagX [Thiomonas sp. X19]|uniref:TrbG/VirB9 family P-type conjugative transfer protein n=1 Tax=Thiomonas sp. X19 TaxID=1050370 RepID=UPI000B6CC4D7|nr:TrbG/VirB9 family P-type conjugative transfer protein [Thiomonas sp. X19]SCC93197.1 Conjugal transfer protein TrbG/VirB9/CagX [Thiomonas sp. X19]